MTQVKDDYVNQSRFEQYRKKHPEETEACFDNLDFLVGMLNSGIPLQQCTFGFFRSEGKDVYRIGQTGVRNAHETRLYIYATITGRDIHLLTIGDKNTQKADIRWCHSTVQKIRRQDSGHDQKE